jgi:hypothetical protein
MSNNSIAKGFFKIKVLENGEVISESDWAENQITNNGYDMFLVRPLMAQSGSLQVSYMAIGTGTAPNATDNVLAGELAARVTAATTNTSSKTAQFAATFASSVFSTQGAKTIQNLGLFNSASTGYLMAGQTYTTSQWNTNQDVNATYQIRFS